MSEHRGADGAGDPGVDDLGQETDPTPSGEPSPDEAPRPRDGEDDDEELATDPETGSTPEDPSVDDTGLPPAGRDPMAGESPSS